MAVNVRVEARKLAPNSSREERMREGYNLHNRFKRACHEANIAHLIKMHETFIRPCDKRRMKKNKKMLAIKRAAMEKKTPTEQPAQEERFF